MKILQSTLPPQGFSWFNYESYIDSMSYRTELYLPFEEMREEKLVRGYDYASRRDNMIDFFKFFFNGHDHNLVVGQEKPDVPWGGFTLDVWKLSGDDFEQKFEFDFKGNLTDETKEYLNLLKSSGIDFKYVGFCTCRDWGAFLRIVLDCVLKNIAPYSPLIYDIQRKIVFYFHHAFSIGIYYQDPLLRTLIDSATACYGLTVSHFNY